MSTYTVIIDNYAGAGYLPDTTPTEFDNLEDAAEYLLAEITLTVQTFIHGWNDRDIPAVESIIESVQNDARYVCRVANIDHYIAEVL